MANIMRLGGYCKAKLKQIYTVSRNGYYGGNFTETIDVKQYYSKYSLLSEEDFAIFPIKFGSTRDNITNNAVTNITYTYEPATGTLKVTFISDYSYRANLSYPIYILDRYNQ